MWQECYTSTKAKVEQWQVMFECTHHLMQSLLLYVACGLSHA
jgi:hypothetical protein